MLKLLSQMIRNYKISINKQLKIKFSKQMSKSLRKRRERPVML